MTHERPIIMSVESVRAILEGKKTQTRRVVMLPKYYQGLITSDDIDKSSFWVAHCLNCQNCKIKSAPCGSKYWQIGDDILPQQYHTGRRLWVRETWAAVSPDEYAHPLRECNLEYRADTDAIRPGGWHLAPNDEYALTWRSPMFMPRWASRLTLEITGIRVERLQEISGQDVLAEGIRDVPLSTGEGKTLFYEAFGITLRDMYMAVWNSLNAKRGYSWESNPWVWVIEFKRVDGAK